MKLYIPAVIVVIAAILVPAVAAADDAAPIGGDMGTYRIHGNVESARVYFDGEFKGNITNGILDVPVYVTGTPYRSFSVEKEGYFTDSGPINSVPSKGSVVNIYATLSAIPPIEYGTLHVLVTPTLSSVSLDGKFVDVVPVTGVLIIRDVVPGNHVVQVSKQGYAAATNDVYVSKNEIKKVPITLSAADNGPLSITSTPPGAEVILDGQTIGVTPLTLPDVSGGQHSIVLKMEGYNDYTENISITGDGATVTAILVPATVTGGSSIGLSPSTLIVALLGAVLLLGLKRYPQ
ncbi:MAG: PEGA domain-containing protein [Methanoregulaceae archaeon]|nr:PEGA domain-containing protein [Methanoregulaceae archaeon]MCU0628570.1 PEGA domain-containing protein [Methanoregulaceae archaeon]